MADSAASSAKIPAPDNCDDFTIAIVCALHAEASAVQAVFDEFYDNTDPKYAKAATDTNAYTLGRIGRHYVVLAHMPNMNTVNATGVAANFHATFSNIALGLVVGICGGAPKANNGQDIFLGDVIFSTAIINDYGRQSDSRFCRKDTLRDNLPRPAPQIGTFLASLQSWKPKSDLRQRIRASIDQILAIEDFKASAHPGNENDFLYASDYRHKHRKEACEICDACDSHTKDVCQKALKASCQSLGCDGRIVREHRTSTDPQIFFGTVHSGNAVMKSAFHRDQIIEEEDDNDVIGFEMEGAGVWDQMPTIVVKGVCDYADAHKNKRWQGYAAVTGAAAAKALLLAWPGVPAKSKAAVAKTESTAKTAPKSNSSPPRHGSQQAGGDINNVSGTYHADQDMWLLNKFNGNVRFAGSGPK